MPSPLDSQHPSENLAPRPLVPPPPPSSTYLYPVDTALAVDARTVDPLSSSSASSASSSYQQDWPPPDGSSSSQRPEDIEMDSISPAGHRRRRSTLNGSNGPPVTAAGRVSQPRSQSTRSTGEPGEGKSPEGIANGSASKAERLADDDSGLSDEDLHDDEETGLTKKDKRRKKAKRRRNTRLDNRIVMDKISEEERKEADQNVVRKLAINGILIGLWYLFSLSISLVRISPFPFPPSRPLREGLRPRKRPIC